ncbi:MAG: cyclase family protein [Defluviitaleaceae bacterium]|nr:cyclase family protein [Defluviitaleaceae bacterium]
MKIYDITATIDMDLCVYVESDRPIFEDLMRIDEGGFCNLTRISATTHMGTHADMPKHFINNGASCHDITLDYFYGRAKVIKIKTAAHINKSDLLPFEIDAGDIILLNTGQSHYIRQPKLKEDFIALTPDAAQYLVDKKIKTLGIDYLSVDPYGDLNFPAHKILLGNRIPILEGLMLGGVPEGEYILSAFPLKYYNGDGSPVRAVLITH